MTNSRSAHVPEAAAHALDAALATRAAIQVRAPYLIDLTRRLALAESPSTDPASQAEAQGILTEALDAIGLGVRHVEGRTTGGYLEAFTGEAPPGRGQLILGHSDTVWDVGTLETMPVVVEDEVIRGPGVFDMKAGLAMGLTAVAALRDVGLTPPLPTSFLITSDEEIGAPDSRGAIDEWARRSERVYVMEPALSPAGRVKTRRKGVAHYHVEVHGRSAHGGLAPEEGASAVLALAGIVRALHDLADPEAGITLNVGAIRGGTRANVVPDYATAEVDARAWDAESAERLDRAIRALRTDVPGTGIEVAGGFDRPPLEPTPRNLKLWEACREIGSGLGLFLEEGAAGGGSDGNFTSIHTATLDGLGAVGDGAHALHEHARIPEMLERTAVLAGLLMLPPEPETRS